MWPTTLSNATACAGMACALAPSRCWACCWPPGCKSGRAHLLSVRYAITLAVGYGIYLLVLRWWAARLIDDEEEHGSADAVMPWMAVDAADLARSVPRSGGPARPRCPRMSDGRQCGIRQRSGDLASGALDGLGGADEGAVVIIPVVAIFLIGAAILAGAGALAMLFFSWDVLLAVAVELAFSVAAVHHWPTGWNRGWLTAAVRLTWKPLWARCCAPCCWAPPLTTSCRRWIRCPKRCGCCGVLGQMLLLCIIKWWWRPSIKRE